MALTSDDLASIDRAIAGGATLVQFADGSRVQYGSLSDLLRVRAMIASQLGTSDEPLSRPGGVTVAEFARF